MTATGMSPPRANLTGYKTQSVPNFTPQQMQLFQQLLGGAQGGVGGGLDFLSGLASGNEGAFESAEKPYYSAFQKTLGDIGSRFAGAGAVGSSAFQNATSGAAQSLSENLGANRMNIRQNAIRELLGLSENLLGQRPYETFMEPKSKGFDWGGLLGGLAGSFGGPIAGGLGSLGLSKLLKLFGG